MTYRINGKYKLKWGNHPHTLTSFSDNWVTLENKNGDRQVIMREQFESDFEQISEYRNDKTKLNI